ncbi:MAG: hypothetical protein ACI9IZ_000733, partial [Nonlabens sp.]
MDSGAFIWSIKYDVQIYKILKLDFNLVSGFG